MGHFIRVKKRDRSPDQSYSHSPHTLEKKRKERECKRESDRDRQTGPHSVKFNISSHLCRRATNLDVYEDGIQNNVRECDNVRET